MDELRESAELIRRGVLWCSRHGVRSSLDRLATWMVDERVPSTRSYAMWSAGRSTPRSPKATIVVSIVVPVRDPEPAHLVALVASVRAQTHQAWELILVDDGSRRPDVRQQLDKLAGCDERVILLRRDGAKKDTFGDFPSSGISATTNRGAAVGGSHRRRRRRRRRRYERRRRRRRRMRRPVPFSPPTEPDSAPL